MAEFYSARGWEIPPLPWTNLSPPFSVGRPVDVRAYADRVAIRQDGEIVAEHPRSFGRGQVAYDPWHYVPILTRKPGALRNGAPFKGWQLPNALGRLRTRLSAHDDGDRQFVKVLAAEVYVAGIFNWWSGRLL